MRPRAGGAGDIMSVTRSVDGDAGRMPDRSSAFRRQRSRTGLPTQSGLISRRGQTRSTAVTCPAGDGRGDCAITQHESRCMRRDPPSENDVRNAIDRVTVSATRIEIVLNESIVVEGQDRVLTLPWTRASSRRRREIIHSVGEAQRPLRAMRTKARDGFILASRDARRWLDELLTDPAQTIELLAMREDKSERSIRMTLSLAFISPVLAEAAMEGRLPARLQRQAPD